MQGLVIELAFAGDHQTRLGDRIVQAGVFGDDSRSRFATRSEREQRRADPAGGPGSGEVPHAAAGLLLHFRDPPGQPRLQASDSVRVCALLRTEHRGRTTRAQQRMLDVAGDHQFRCGQTPLSHNEPAKARDEPRTPIRAAAAAKTDHDSGGSTIERSRDQLPDSGAVRTPGGIDRRRTFEQRQPAGLRAFDVGGRAVEQPLRVDILIQRAAYSQRMPVRRDQLRSQHVDEPGSSV
ncbi:Uncharacterised protein [Mycobacteroides abscessus subsp. massiliense]|nr:Uncharacterised protein [Mycobacteroides abscessus subsp. massiliense]